MKAIPCPNCSATLLKEIVKINRKKLKKWVNARYTGKTVI